MCCLCCHHRARGDRARRAGQRILEIAFNHEVSFVKAAAPAESTPMGSLYFSTPLGMTREETEMLARLSSARF
jgi:hypothetical protein